MNSSHPFKIAILFCLALTACSGSSSGSSALSDQQLEGKRVFDQYCKSCHAVQGDAIVTGPSLDGIANIADKRVQGLTAEEYLLQSIEKPSAFIVDGFEDIMPVSLGQELTGEEKEAIIAYLLSLR